MAKRRLDEIDAETSTDLQSIKKPKLNPRSVVFKEKLDESDFKAICKAIEESELGQIHGWNVDLVEVMALFSMGDWYPCWLCSELNSMSHEVREKIGFVNCWFCENDQIELYAHFCVACDDACTTPEEIGPYCVDCQECFCYEHILECKKCGEFVCDECVKKNNKCVDCLWKKVPKEQIIDLTK